MMRKKIEFFLMLYEVYILVEFLTEFTVMHLLSEEILKGEKNKRNNIIKI